jgi:hypothetical protein
MVKMHKETVYFIGDRFNTFLPATKKNLFNMFNSRKSEIEAFMQENKTMLNQERDLIALIDFLDKK